MRAMDFPKTVEEIFEDYQRRRSGLLRALTDGKFNARSVWRKQCREARCLLAELPFCRLGGPVPASRPRAREFVPIW